MKYLFAGLLIMTSFLWAGNFVVGKSLVNHASPMTLTDLRWMIAVVCLIPIVWIKEKRILPPKEAILPLIIMGATGVILFNLFMFLALEHTEAINVGLLSALNPVSIAIFSYFLVGDKIRPLQIVGMSICFLGVIFFITKGELSRLVDLKFNIGDVWMLVAVASWGVYSVSGRWAMKKVSPMMATLFSGLFGVLMLLPFNLPTFKVTHIDFEFVLSILYIGILSTVVSMVFWNIGVQKIGGTTAGMFLNFNPIFTAVLAFFLLGERMNWAQVGGSIVVIAGCYLFLRLNTQAPKTLKES